MKKEITLGQFLSVAAAVLIAIATGWLTMSNKIAVAESNIRELQNLRDVDRVEYKAAVNELKFKIDDSNAKILGILLELQNKQNRP